MHTNPNNFGFYKMNKDVSRDADYGENISNEEYDESVSHWASLSLHPFQELASELIGASVGRMSY